MPRKEGKALDVENMLHAMELCSILVVDAKPPLLGYCTYCLDVEPPEW